MVSSDMSVAVVRAFGVLTRTVLTFKVLWIKILQRIELVLGNIKGMPKGLFLGQV